MILEQILNELQKLNANLAAGASIGPGTTGMASGGGGLGVYAAPPQQYAGQVQPAPVQPAPMQQAAPTGVNADMITALIQPHIGNDAMKAAFGSAMRNMGINALPETPEHMYGPLYQAFQGVIAQYAGQAAPAAQPASII